MFQISFFYFFVLFLVNKISANNKFKGAKMNSKYLQVFIVFSILIFGHGSLSAADVLFEDNFDVDAGGMINYGAWTVPEGDAAIFGQSALRNPNIPDWMTSGLPQEIFVENGAAQLRLDTFNPTDWWYQQGYDNSTFWGSEMDTIQQWSPTSTEAIRFEARVKNDVNTPSGVVTSVFGFGLTGVGTNKDEIDFEFLSKQYLDTTSPETLMVNSFNDEPYTSAGTPELLAIDLDFSVYNTFRMDWYDDQIQWYVNDMFVYSQDVTLSHAMGLRLNTWVPDSYFGQAYDSSLVAAAQLADNQTYIYEVDWARVSSFADSSAVPEPATIILFGIGVVGAALRKK